MDYDIALKLKEAGFPQDEDKIDRGDYFVTTHGDVKNPTLVELMDACGDEFVALRKDNGMWHVQGKRIKDGKVTHFAQGWSNPTEAVAGLWLELNQNNVTKTK